MPQKRLNNDEFLTELTSLFSSTHSANHGSVFLTQKSLPSQDTPMTDDTSERTTTQQILIRASNGASESKDKSKTGAKAGASKVTKSAKPSEKGTSKVKLATVVDVTELDSFYARYAEVCKRSMEGMRKRDKKKAKEKAKAAKKKGKGGSST